MGKKKPSRKYGKAINKYGVPKLRDILTGLITFNTILENLQFSVMGKKKPQHKLRLSINMAATYSPRSRTKYHRP